MDVRENIREEGRWAGMQEGEKKGRQKVALNLLKEKINISVISKVTGLPANKIKKLKNGA